MNKSTSTQLMSLIALLAIGCGSDNDGDQPMQTLLSQHDSSVNTEDEASLSDEPTVMIDANADTSNPPEEVNPQCPPLKGDFGYPYKSPPLYQLRALASRIQATALYLNTRIIATTLLCSQSCHYLAIDGNKIELTVVSIARKE